MRSREEIEKELDDAYKELGEVEGECGRFEKNVGPLNQEIPSHVHGEMKVAYDKRERIINKIKKLKDELDQCAERQK